MVITSRSIGVACLIYYKRQADSVSAIGLQRTHIVGGSEGNQILAKPASITIEPVYQPTTTQRNNFFLASAKKYCSGCVTEDPIRLSGTYKTPGANFLSDRCAVARVVVEMASDMNH